MTLRATALEYRSAFRRWKLLLLSSSWGPGRVWSVGSREVCGDGFNFVGKDHASTPDHRINRISPLLLSLPLRLDASEVVALDTSLAQCHSAFFNIALFLALRDSADHSDGKPRD